MPRRLQRLFTADLRLYEYDSHPGVVYIRAKDIDPLFQLFDIQVIAGLAWCSVLLELAAATCAAIISTSLPTAAGQ